MHIHTNYRVPDTPDHHPTHQSSLQEDELSQARQISSERSNTIYELQGQLVAHASILQSDTEQEKEERESMSAVRDELHRQAGYLLILESTKVKLPK